MTTKQKIKAIKTAIENAKNHQSKMDDTAWSVPALSSLKIRHLMNNLGAISNIYLEIGVHRGGLFCSTIRNNKLEIAYHLDSFESDKTSGECIEDEFDKNSLACVDGTDTVLLGQVTDTFAADLDPIENVDLYLYDAAHDYQSQREAITHFLPCMAKEFILCVDDHDWDDVHKGTHDGLKDAGVEILFEEAFNGGDHDNDTWWNGFYVALLKKK